MNEFFGIPMTAVLIASMAIVAVIVGSVLWVRWRQPILFDIGVRNIPRRPAQSVLIVVGLMLSTVIFSAALAVGDTVTYSITRDTYEKLGSVDEIVQVRSNTRTPSFEDEQIFPLGLVRPREYSALVADFNGYGESDGLLRALRFPAPLTNRDLDLTDSTVVVVGLDPDSMAGFESDLVFTDGTPANVGDLPRASIFVNESLARKLNLSGGEVVNLWIDSLPRTLRVAGIVKDRYLTGWTLDEPEGIVINLSEASFLFGLPAGISDELITSFVAISNDGDGREGLAHSDEVTQEAIDSLRTSRLQVVSLKADRIDDAERTGANLTAIFIVLSLFTIAAGVLLIFLILVMLAAERRPEMGMSRAVGMKQRQLIESFMAEGMAYSLTAAAGGALLGVAVSLAMTQAMQYIFNATDVDVSFHLEPRSLVIAFALGIAITYGTLIFSAWRVSRLSIVAAIREVDEPPPRATGRASLVLGAISIALGIGLTIWGLQSEEAYQVGAGVSIALIGAAFSARSFGLPERVVFTTTSALVLVLWVLVAGDNLSAMTGSLDSGLATFFVGGVLMVAAATFVIVFNADVLLGAIRAIGLISARALPAVRTAIAYPAANRLRTGMTIAMLSLVVFALVMISTMSLNFRQLFLDPAARGGWDVEIFSQPTNDFPDQDNPRGPLGEALDRGFYETRKLEAISQVLASNPQRTQIEQVLPDGGTGKEDAFQVFGGDDTFLDENAIRLQARASDYADDRAVWDAVKNDPKLAVIDGSVVPGINYANVREDRFKLEGYESGDEVFEPFKVALTDTGFDTSQEVTVIGIMERGPSETYRGIWLSAAGMLQAEIPPLNTRYLIRLQDGLNAEAEAADMEELLAEYGVAADSIEKEIADQQALSNAFFLLIQGFLAIGLGVGLVALAVIAFRTVVERRQQIGLLRAIGFTRTDIGLWFALESAFVTLLGIANGIWPALLLANRLLASEQFSAAGFQTFHVPWMQIALMSMGVFAASVLTTLIPSRQASNIPPAEALRYE